MGLTNVALTDQSVATAGVDESVDQIKAQTDATLMLQSTGGILTADGTEQTLYQDNEPLGTHYPRVLFVDLDAMLALDVIVLRVYYRISDAGGLQLYDIQTFTGIDGGLASPVKLTTIEFLPNRHGFHATLEQTAGTNRTYPWEFLGEL
jgi:hypothetical protein